MDGEIATQARRRRSTFRRRVALILLILVWALVYNMLIKRQRPGAAFFGILDTISDDFVMGTLVAIVLGVVIAIVFSVTKLYTQMVVIVDSFRILEDIVFTDLLAGRFRTAFLRLIRLEDEPHGGECCPQHVSFMLLCCGLIYLVSWVYVVLFAEALFFVSWSAGVDLQVNEQNVLLLPTLALALPFSARVMAYLRYPYAQDYADFMPGALFVLLVVAALGYQFGSPDQQFFLLRVYRNEQYLASFVANGAFLAFIPVFFESVFWLFELERIDERAQQLLNRYCLEYASDGVITEEELFEIQRLAAELEIPVEKRDAILKRAREQVYWQEKEKAELDGVVTDEERAALARLRDSLGLSRQRPAASRDAPDGDDPVDPTAAG